MPLTLETPSSHCSVNERIEQAKAPYVVVRSKFVTFIGYGIAGSLAGIALIKLVRNRRSVTSNSVLSFLPCQVAVYREIKTWLKQSTRSMSQFYTDHIVAPAR